ncbi:hypothetical protein JCM17478_31850 [Thermopirellula anaerolimosa]
MLSLPPRPFVDSPSTIGDADFRVPSSCAASSIDARLAPEACDAPGIPRTWGVKPSFPDVC